MAFSTSRTLLERSCAPPPRASAALVSARAAPRAALCRGEGGVGGACLDGCLDAPEPHTSLALSRGRRALAALGKKGGALARDEAVLDADAVDAALGGEHREEALVVVVVHGAHDDDSGPRGQEIERRRERQREPRVPGADGPGAGLVQGKPRPCRELRKNTTREQRVIVGAPRLRDSEDQWKGCAALGQSDLLPAFEMVVAATQTPRRRPKR
jgi:hypothetical protein